MVNAPSISLKVIVIAHIVLTVWASLVGPGFLGPSYLYMNAFVLAFGIWAIVNPESSEAVFMFLLLNLISIIMDIIFLAIFTQPGKAIYENMADTYRFSLGMAIVNLIIKPFDSFVLYRIYQDRGGQYSELGVSGLPGFGGGSAGNSSNYENIEQPVETAAPHQSIPKSSPYGPTP